MRLVGDLADEPDFPPLRIGIHTGPALSSDGDWYGRTVNVAARLCSLAPAGALIVSARTRDAAGEIDGVKWSTPELRWLRNVSAPVGTYLVTAHQKADCSPGREPAATRPLTWLGRPALSEVTA